MAESADAATATAHEVLRAAFTRLIEHVDALTDGLNDEVARVVATNWNPPVMASARLVSIIDDCAQHLGQAAYVRGIAC